MFSWRILRVAPDLPFLRLSFQVAAAAAQGKLVLTSFLESVAAL
jgi:hypothetical protein